MRTATIREAQHHLSKLVDEVLETGHEVVLTRRGKEVCKITPVQTPAIKTVAWDQLHRDMRERFARMPKFDYGIVEKMREEERF